MFAISNCCCCARQCTEYAWEASIDDWICFSILPVHSDFAQKVDLTIERWVIMYASYYKIHFLPVPRKMCLFRVFSFLALTSEKGFLYRR